MSRRLSDCRRDGVSCWKTEPVFCSRATCPPLNLAAEFVPLAGCGVVKGMGEGSTSLGPEVVGAGLAGMGADDWSEEAATAAGDWGGIVALCGADMLWTLSIMLFKSWSKFPLPMLAAKFSNRASTSLDEVAVVTVTASSRARFSISRCFNLSSWDPKEAGMVGGGGGGGGGGGFGDAVVAPRSPAEEEEEEEGDHPVPPSMNTPFCRWNCSRYEED